MDQFYSTRIGSHGGTFPKVEMAGGRRKEHEQATTYSARATLKVQVIQ